MNINGLSESKRIQIEKDINEMGIIIKSCLDKLTIVDDLMNVTVGKWGTYGVVRKDKFEEYKTALRFLRNHLLDFPISKCVRHGFCLPLFYRVTGFVCISIENLYSLTSWESSKINNERLDDFRNLRKDLNHILSVLIRLKKISKVS